MSYGFQSVPIGGIVHIKIKWNLLGQIVTSDFPLALKSRYRRMLNITARYIHTENLKFVQNAVLLIH